MAAAKALQPQGLAAWPALRAGPPKRLLVLGSRHRRVLIPTAAPERQVAALVAAQEAAGGPAAAAAGDAALVQRELLELRALVAQQQEDRAQALELIQRQQQALQLLEERLGLEASAAAAAQLERPASVPLDGPAAVMEPSLLSRRVAGSYDKRNRWSGASRDLRTLPRRIVLVRHAQSKGNVDPFQYTYVPDPSVPLTSKGWDQALEAGEKLKAMVEADHRDSTAPHRLFFYCSPYLRCKQTTEGILQAFSPDQLLGVQEEVMLREQDFGGSFQDAEAKKREKVERLRYGRFFYRFPNGESGADVYSRMTIFQDHLVRDMDAGRYGEDCTLVLVTHGLASRIFLQRWFHWTVQQFTEVWNPPNAEPIVMELIPQELVDSSVNAMHTKALYRLSDESRTILKGCSEDMCATSWAPRGIHWASPSEHSPPERTGESDSDSDDGGGAEVAAGAETTAGAASAAGGEQQ